MEEGIIRVEAKFSKQFFPKFDEHVEEGDFAIVSWEVVNVEEGTPEMHSFFNTITTKGMMCEFSRLDTYTIIAREAPNDFGMQYDLIYIGQPADLSDPKAQRSFLERILTPIQVDSLFMEFDDPIKIIESRDIESLCKVKGIGKSTAGSILSKFDEHKDYSQVYIELDDFGITNRMIQKLVETYGSPQTVINKVKTNPYQLASEVNGIGFKKADAIAMDNGLEWDSLFRIQGFVEYSLEQRAEDGNSFVYADELMYMIDEALGNVGGEKIGNAVTQMVADGKLGLESGAEGTHKKVYLTSYYELEAKVAKEIRRLLNAPNNFVIDDWKEKVKQVEENQGWEHTEEQIDGIRQVLENQISVIHGKGGTGKTSVVTAMLEALNTSKLGGYTFAQTALSGRASAKLQEVTGAEGFTMHRLLGYNPAEGFKFDKDSQLDYDIIILDEISLVGGRIFLSLIEAIKSGSKLVILGDDGQLESIGCMNLARDLITSPLVPATELNQIHRQAKRSGIITQASDIRERKQLFESDFRGTSIRGELQDFELNVIENLEDTRPKMIDQFRHWLPKVGDIMDIQMLVPVNERGDASVDKLNDDIQSIYNPYNPKRLETEVMINKKKDKKFIVREMDKVMIMKNNYKTLNEEYQETPVFNGWIGTVKSIQDDAIIVYFPVIKQNVIIPQSFLINVRLGYACSVHKFQGSSAKVIIGGIDYSTPPFMRTKELVYTLVTRAEQYCILVTQAPALREAIETSGVSEKNTFLVELLS